MLLRTRLLEVTHHSSPLVYILVTPVPTYYVPTQHDVQESDRTALLVTAGLRGLIGDVDGRLGRGIICMCFACGRRLVSGPLDLRLKGGVQA